MIHSLPTLASVCMHAQDHDGSGALSYLELALRPSRKPPQDVLCRKFLTALTFDGARAAGRAPLRSRSADAVDGGAAGGGSNGSTSTTPPSTSSRRPPLLDTSNFNFIEGDTEELREAINAWLRGQGASVADFYEHLSGDRARREFALGKGQRVEWAMNKKEFELGFYRLGFYAEPSVLERVFAACDTMGGGDGKIGFSELYMWLHGMLDSAKRARKATIHDFGLAVHEEYERITDWNPQVCGPSSSR